MFSEFLNFTYSKVAQMLLKLIQNIDLEAEAGEYMIIKFKKWGRTHFVNQKVPGSIPPSFATPSVDRDVKPLV